MWVDGYWEGPLKDGYPLTYWRGENHDIFGFPWEERTPKPDEPQPDEPQHGAGGAQDERGVRT